MLRPKQPRRPRPKSDHWFKPRRYAHFDHPVLSRKTAMEIVATPEVVAAHPFLPLMTFEKRVRRFNSAGRETPTGSTKVRKLAYCSNRDAVVYAWYASILSGLYDKRLKEDGMSSLVTAYRKGSSNILLALEAFDDIRRRGACTVLALDISGFFDNISHAVLKQHWADLVGDAQLPRDHFHVFTSLTRYSKVDRAACLQRLGIDPRTPNRELKSPLCPISDFRARIRRASPLGSGLVERHRETKGVPQGTPLSALAANISMLGFDRAMRDEAARLGATYRRYSDDILIICDPAVSADVSKFTIAALAKHAQTLCIKDTKTQIVEFPGANVRVLGKPLDYLGFTFDGRQILLRSATLARYWRRMAAAVRWAQRMQSRAQKGKTPGRDTLHRRKLLMHFSHLGSESLYNRYARNAAERMSAPAILRQFRRHMAVLNARIDAPAWRRVRRRVRTLRS
jgi:hypothetical protein